MSGYTLRAHAFVTAPLLALAGVSIVVHSIVWNAIECALPVDVEQFAGQQTKQVCTGGCMHVSRVSTVHCHPLLDECARIQHVRLVDNYTVVACCHRRLGATHGVHTMHV